MIAFEEWICFPARMQALFAAWVSVLIGCVITLLAFYSGFLLDVMSLYALSIMSAVDTVSSILVIIFWQQHQTELDLTTEQCKKEQKYTYWVGIMMITMGALLFGDSVKSLYTHGHPYFTNSIFSTLGIVISGLGAISGLLLGWYKFFIAKALRSPLVYADGISSLCAGLASLVAFIIAEDQSLAWWTDAAAGTVIAVYTIYQGYRTAVNSSEKLKILILEENHPIAKYQDMLISATGSYQNTPIRLMSTSAKTLTKQPQGEASWLEKFVGTPYFYAVVWLGGGSGIQLRYFNNQEYLPVDQLDFYSVDEEISFHA